MLAKLKEHAAAMLLSALAALFVSILSEISREVGPLVLDTLSRSVSPTALLRLLSMCLLTMMIEMSFVIYLILKLKTKLKPRFGMLWDREKNPHCPACQSLLADLGNCAIGSIRFKCLKCNQGIMLVNDKGSIIELDKAKSLLA